MNDTKSARGAVTVTLRFAGQFVLAGTTALLCSLGIAHSVSGQSVVSSTQHVPSAAEAVAGMLARRAIHDVRMSPDGASVVCVTEEPDSAGTALRRTLWLLTTDGKGSPQPLSTDRRDGAPQWSRDGRSIVFLTTRDGSSQVWAMDVATRDARQLTHVGGNITRFAMAPDGHRMAIVTRQPPGQPPSTAGGVVLDKWSMSVYDILQGRLGAPPPPPARLSILNLDSGRSTVVIDSANVTGIHWSPDGNHIALDIGPQFPNPLGTQRIMMYDPAGRQLRTIFQGKRSKDWDGDTTYAIVGWSSDSRTLWYTMTPQAARWQAAARLGAYTIATGERQLLTPSTLEMTAHPSLRRLADGSLGAERVMHGTSGLFRLSSDHQRWLPVTDTTRSVSSISFSRDLTRMAFVRESLTEPPELYVATSDGHDAHALTTWNAAVARAAHDLRAERVTWQSDDGVTVHGWLLRSSQWIDARPQPLLVMVHGGPGVPLTNQFEPYGGQFAPYGAWPYPFHAFAQRGYAVFLPNYRGTRSYGYAFATPRTLTGEPVNDIVSGIRALIRRGIADSTKIGIMGHSHGAWLGPEVMTRHHIFAAASFAEGGVDELSSYGLMPGWLNLNIHEYYKNGKSPYQDPQRYLDDSPVFHLDGVTTPTLVEAGEVSLSVHALEFVSGLWRMGIPHEGVIYPKEGHNPSRLATIRATAARNLEWFDYWMLGRRDPDPARAEQYARWERMKRDMAHMRAIRTTSTSAGVHQ